MGDGVSRINDGLINEVLVFLVCTNSWKSETPHKANQHRRACIALKIDFPRRTETKLRIQRIPELLY